jgi:hypothetical protein
MLPADDDLGKALVVAQQHVEPRLQLLDQVDLEQQGVGLGADDDELHGPRQVDHVGDALGVEAPLRILKHPLLQRARLAHIEHLAVLADHAIDAGLVGQPFDLVLDEGGALQQGRSVEHGRDIGRFGGFRQAPRQRNPDCPAALSFVTWGSVD